MNKIITEGWKMNVKVLQLVAAVSQSLKYERSANHTLENHTIYRLSLKITDFEVTLGTLELKILPQNLINSTRRRHYIFVDE